MSRFDPARLRADSYPFAAEVETRFGDLDPLGHINNVAVGSLYEQGRVRFNRSFLPGHARRGTPDIRWLVARVDINYVAEAHFPAPVLITSGIGRIGNASWTILSAGFQDGACVSLCDTTLVYTTADGASPIPDDLRQLLEGQRFPV